MEKSLVNWVALSDRYACTYSKTSLNKYFIVLVFHSYPTLTSVVRFYFVDAKWMFLCSLSKRCAYTWWINLAFKLLWSLWCWNLGYSWRIVFVHVYSISGLCFIIFQSPFLCRMSDEIIMGISIYTSTWSAELSSYPGYFQGNLTALDQWLDVRLHYLHC